jgi:hypothetical protein
MPTPRRLRNNSRPLNSFLTIEGFSYNMEELTNTRLDYAYRSFSWQNNQEVIRHNGPHDTYLLTAYFGDRAVLRVGNSTPEYQTIIDWMKMRKR